MAKCFIGLHKYEVIKEVEVKDVDTDTNQIAEMWLFSNGYNSNEVNYMLTDECPLCVVNNVETHLNL